MTLKDQIIVVFQESKTKTMHVDEIAQRLLSKYPDLQIPPEVLSEKVSSVLSNEVRKKKNQTIFGKVKNKKGGLKRGIYRLKMPVSRKIQRTTQIANQPKVSSLYTGKAGEFAVMSELLFYGFNPSSMTVDEGIDIVAEKENHYFHIQVKTANASKDNKFSFKVTSKAFSTNNSSSTFYILVMRIIENAGNLCEYLVFHSSEIQRMIGRGVVGSGDSLSMSIERQRGNKYMLNSLEDVTWALNRFDTIR